MASDTAHSPLIGDFITHNTDAINQEWTNIKPKVQSHSNGMLFVGRIEKAIASRDARNSDLHHLTQALTQYQQLPDIDEFIDTLAISFAIDQTSQSAPPAPTEVSEHAREELWKVPVYDQDMRIMARKPTLASFKKKIENAWSYRPPQSETQEKVCAALGIPADILFGSSTYSSNWGGYSGYSTSYSLDPNSNQSSLTPLQQQQLQKLEVAKQTMFSKQNQSHSEIHSKDLSDQEPPRPVKLMPQLKKEKLIQLAKVAKERTTLQRATKVVVEEIPSYWTEDGSLLIRGKNFSSPSDKVAAFDMDSTLIKTKSGRLFPINSTDWVWLYDSVPEKIKQYIADGWKIVIITNQLGISKATQSAMDITSKIDAIARAFGEDSSNPITALVATKKDRYRKPSPFLWDYFIDKLNNGQKPSQAIFVGDAAGRPGDHSSNDRSFAFNIGIPFKTEKEFFLDRPVEQWNESEHENLSRLLNASPVGSPSYDTLIPQVTEREIVILVGPPGSGKSTISKNVFAKRGYALVNLDTVMSASSCLQLAKASILRLQSVVIDQTSPSLKARRPYLELAKELNCTVRCVVLKTPIVVAKHLNRLRSWFTTTKLVPDVAYNVYLKTYEEPTKAEGYSDVIFLDFRLEGPEDMINKLNLLNGEIHEFELSRRYTVDKIKDKIFNQVPSLRGASKLDYQLGFSRDSRLSVEFIKFCDCHESVKKIFESTPSQDQAVVELTLFPRESKKLQRQMSVAVVPNFRNATITHKKLGSQIGGTRVLAAPRTDLGKDTPVPAPIRSDVAQVKQEVYSSSPTSPRSRPSILSSSLFPSNASSAPNTPFRQSNSSDAQTSTSPNSSNKPSPRNLIDGSSTGELNSSSASDNNNNDESIQTSVKTLDSNQKDVTQSTDDEQNQKQAEQPVVANTSLKNSEPSSLNLQYMDIDVVDEEDEDDRRYRRQQRSLSFSEIAGASKIRSERSSLNKGPRDVKVEKSFMMKNFRNRSGSIIESSTPIDPQLMSPDLEVELAALSKKKKAKKQKEREKLPKSEKKSGENKDESSKQPKKSKDDKNKEKEKKKKNPDDSPTPGSSTKRKKSSSTLKAEITRTSSSSSNTAATEPIKSQDSPSSSTSTTPREKRKKEVLASGEDSSSHEDSVQSPPSSFKSRSSVPSLKDLKDSKEMQSLTALMGLKDLQDLLDLELSKTPRSPPSSSAPHANSETSPRGSNKSPRNAKSPKRTREEKAVISSIAVSSAVLMPGLRVAHGPLKRTVSEVSANIESNSSSHLPARSMSPQPGRALKLTRNMLHESAEDLMPRRLTERSMSDLIPRSGSASSLGNARMSSMSSTQSSHLDDAGMLIEEDECEEVMSVDGFDLKLLDGLNDGFNTMKRESRLLMAMTPSPGRRNRSNSLLGSNSPVKENRQSGSFEYSQKTSYAEMRSGSFSIDVSSRHGINSSKANLFDGISTRYDSHKRINSNSSTPPLTADDYSSLASSRQSSILYLPRTSAPLMKPCRGFWVEVGRENLDSGLLLLEKTFALDNAAEDILWYSQYYAGREHSNYIGLDGSGEPFCLSLVRQTNPANSHSKLLRILMRTKKGDERSVIQESLLKKQGSKLFTKSKTSNVPISEVMKILNPELAAKCSKLRQIKDPALVNDLIQYETQQRVTTYKFGILLCKEGQTKEEEMFSNEFGSEMYDQFLELLGDTVELKGWDNYRGGLDCERGTTGTHSIYTRWNGIEIMFHVSTLLPYSTDNPQQLERKRHLGNDIVVLVFKEGNTPYIPNTISSEFIHVVGVVQPEIHDENVMYRLSVASKDGVPPFSPSLPVNGLFERGEAFRNLILAKLVNGERAAYKAPAFLGKFQRTRSLLLKDLENRYK